MNIAAVANHKADYNLYLRAANYLSAAQIYLKENALLQEPLQASHIKPRLLGHWGTCPGINLIYTYLNRLIVEKLLDLMLIIGPGHGAPAYLSNLFLEGSLSEYYPQIKQNAAGIHELVRGFSWPGGFPSHIFPGLPGAIHEGGELGYALATAFGAAFDNPDLIVACIVGDGEAETGPTATAWHGTKFLDPRESGAVLPFLHLNGYKISNPTILGSMNDDELTQLFRGYGWEPLFVQSRFEAEIWQTMNYAFSVIKNIQNLARSGTKPNRTRWPMIILRSPKGMTGVKELDGKPIEGSFRAHQVPVTDPTENPEHLAVVEKWLKSYRPEELFNEEGVPRSEILACTPRGNSRIGVNPHTFGGRVRRALVQPKLESIAIELKSDLRGETQKSPSEAAANYLTQIIVNNPETFRIFSPDELTSNKLGKVFEVTHRNYQWPIDGDNHNEHQSQEGGRVLEILSEHTCQAWLQGYLLTGRHGIFPSYEAFLNIITSMMDQFSKFLKLSDEYPWREPISSLNYLETSTLWRQEHNGFSHQSPGFINSLLNKKKDILRVYLPPDANCLISTLDHCLASKDYVNLIISNKGKQPVWLSMEEAIAHCRAGAGIWEWASSANTNEPDLVLVGIGDIVTIEILAAAEILLAKLPMLKIRVVNVTDLLILDPRHSHPHGLDEEKFSELFTKDKPVIINFHGYPSAIEQLLYGRDVSRRFHINGYREEGTTTTPFDMLVRNGTSRYQIVLQAIAIALPGQHVGNELKEEFQKKLEDFQKYITQNGEDPAEIQEWKWIRR